MFLTLVLAFLCNGCSIDDDGANFHFTALEIVDAEVPESFVLNKTYKIKDSLTTRSVVAIGAVRTDIDDCMEELIQETASFNFQVIYTEPYTFKFYTGDNSEGEAEYLEIVVPVNNP